jgi:hypothetical protein
MMMSNYIDFDSFYHDKPVLNHMPSSNNPWVYTAYAKTLSLTVAEQDWYEHILVNCAKPRDGYLLFRTIKRVMPPVSRDEYLGMAVLAPDGLYDLMIDNNWYTYDKDVLDCFTWIDAICAAILIRNEHRNHFWQKEVLPVYKLAFKVWAHDRYFIKRMYGEKTSLIEFFSFYLYAIYGLLFADDGNTNLLWLQLKNLNSPLHLFINAKKSFLNYFGKDHIFNKKALK